MKLTTRPTVLPAVAAILILTAVACTPGGGSTGSTATPTQPPSGTPTAAPTAADTGPISYATGPADLVLQATAGGGLIPEWMRLTEMPNVSIYGDGRVVELVEAGGESDPLLPVLTEARLTPDGMALVLQAAREAGLMGPDRRYNLEGVYDLWSVWFTTNADGQSHRISAYALGFEDEAKLAPPDEMEARRKLDAFYGRVIDLRSWLPAGTIGADAPFQPAGTRVYVSRLVDWSTAGGGATPAPVTPKPGQDVREWPLDSPPDLFGVPISEKDPTWRCAVIDASGVKALGLETATRATRWQADGQMYQVVARPLLPDESGCPAG